MSFFVSLVPVTCPACGRFIPHSSLEFRGQPSIAAVTCAKCGTELQVVRDQFNKLTVEAMKKN
jgi:DNA-directed RNA polymerase subunit N (RpoN/RPB10)